MVKNTNVFVAFLAIMALVVTSVVIVSDDSNDSSADVSNFYMNYHAYLEVVGTYGNINGLNVDEDSDPHTLYLYMDTFDSRLACIYVKVKDGYYVNFTPASMTGISVDTISDGYWKISVNPNTFVSEGTYYFGTTYIYEGQLSDSYKGKYYYYDTANISPALSSSDVSALSTASTLFYYDYNTSADLDLLEIITQGNRLSCPVMVQGGPAVVGSLTANIPVIVSNTLTVDDDTIFNDDLFCRGLNADDAVEITLNRNSMIEGDVDIDSVTLYGSLVIGSTTVEIESIKLPDYTAGDIEIDCDSTTIGDISVGNGHTGYFYSKNVEPAIIDSVEILGYNSSTPGFMGNMEINTFEMSDTGSSGSFVKFGDTYLLSTIVINNFNSICDNSYYYVYDTFLTIENDLSSELNVVTLIDVYGDSMLAGKITTTTFWVRSNVKALVGNYLFGEFADFTASNIVIDTDGSFVVYGDVDLETYTIPSLMAIEYDMMYLFDGELFSIEMSLNYGASGPNYVFSQDGNSYFVCPNPPTREGYTFKGWEYENIVYYPTLDPTPGSDDYLLTDVIVTQVLGSPDFISVWEQNAVNVTASAGAGGSISPSGFVSVNIGSDQSFSFAPDEGYKISGVTVNGRALSGSELSSAINSGSYTMRNVTENGSIYVSFTPNAVISAGSSEGGSISPSGRISVTEGSSQSFSFSADEGYKIGDVIVDGSSIGTPSSYTFSNVTSNHSIEVSFISIEPVYFHLTTSSHLKYTIFSPEGGEILGNMPLDVNASVEEVTGYTIKEVYVNGSLYATFDDLTLVTDIHVSHVTSDIEIYVVEVPITGVYITPYMYDVVLTAGTSKDVGIVAWNSNEGDPVRVKLYDSKLLSSKNQEVSYVVRSDDTQWGAGYLDEDNNDSTQFIATLTATEYSSGGNAKLILYFVVSENPDSEYGTAAIMQGIVINITIIPAMSLVEDYDKFLGIWYIDSLIDGTDSSIVAFLSLILLLIILIVVMWLTYSRFKMWMERRHVPLKTKQSARLCIQFAVLAALTYIVAKCIFINGASFRVLAYTSMTSNALYIICVMAIVLLVLDEIKRYAIHKYSKDDSLLPLAFALTKVAVIIGSFAAAFDALGTSLAYVVATLGIMTTALGFGFKSTLVRILDGMILTGTKVFKPGDLIRLNSSPQVLRVVHVGFMSTRLTNWLNSEEYIMPNDSLETAQIVNMSKGHEDYRVFIFVDVAKDTDMHKVEKLLLEVANNNDHVVKDGSMPLPRIHVADMDGSGVKYRLAVYIDSIEAHLSIAGELREQVYESFADNGVKIPFPQKEVHFDGVNKEVA